MDVELQATCSALGYLEGNTYVKEPDCLETVKDLIRFLRRDTDTCDIRRQLGHAKIVQNDLVPLFKGYHQDKTLFETVIKLLVNLTQPVAACFNNQIPDEKTLRNFCLEIESHLQDTKEAFVDDELFSVLTDKIKDILKLDWESRREEDWLQLERLLVLVRNVLMIPPDPDRELRTDDDATIHDQILWASHTSGLEDLLLYVASSDRERSRLCMHVMEIISLMFREHEVETLASAGVQRSMNEKDKDQRELEVAREKEKAMKKNNILKYSARHSRFGGTFVMQNVKSITESDVIYHKPLCEVEMFSYDDGKVPKKKSKNLAPLRMYNNKRRSTLSMRLSLKEFCVQFLMNAYNPLMRAVKDALTRSKSDDHDETYYLWAMRYFMEFCRLHCKRVDLVSETMSMAAFHYIYVQLCTYYENVALGKSEEAKTWGQRSHLALKAYQELLKTLDFMTKSKDTQIHESAKVIQSNVFYMMEYRDIFVTLLKKFKESKSSRSYLRDLVESTHIFLKMLETFSKGNRNILVQSKRKKGGKKKAKPTANIQDPPLLSEEELTALWDNDISEQLKSLLQNGDDIPTGVSPFDAASDVSVDEQRVEAMLRIQSCIREKNLGEAIAMLRAAREVWPEGDSFGSDTGMVEEEMDSLKVIFMADLPRPESQATQEDIEGEDEINEELQDEMDDVRRNEQSFDFKLFINDFAHPQVVKTYATLLNEFTENSDAVNHCIVKLFHRIGHDLGYMGMMFQASIFRSFSRLLHGPLAKLDRYKEIRTFACWVVRQFTRVASFNKKVFVDLMFWKGKNEALAITGDYDFRPKSKAKVTWSEHDADELACLFEKYKDMTQPEMDTLDMIMQYLTSDHSRMQVLRELKNQGLITSAKDLKRKSASIRKHQWTDEQIQELRNVFDLHKEAQHPIASIMEHLSLEKSKASVVKKILELGLVGDRKELRKKRKSEGGKRRKRGDSSEDDDDDDDNSGDDDSSDEGERLFPETNKRDRRMTSPKQGKGHNDDDSDDDDDYREGDSDDDDVDEDVMLLVRQSAAGVGDYIMRLVENGYKDQIAWIQTCLRNVSEDREEGICIPTPLVPLTEENETAMEDEIFLIFLRSIGITPPANEQEMFWRIPKEFTTPDLKSIADGLKHDESGVAAGAETVQAIVSRFFPGGTTSSSSKSSKENKKEKRKKEKEDKKKKREERKNNKRKEKTKAKKNKKSFDNEYGNSDGLSEGRDFSDKNDDDDDDDDDNGAIFVTNRQLNEASHSATTSGIQRKEEDEDTSDSGLDPEIEAVEQDRIRKEKQDEKKGSKSGKLMTEKKRKELLEKILEKKNKRKKRERPSSSGQDIGNGAASTDDETKDVTGTRNSQGKPRAKSKTGKTKGKRIKLLDSDSDSNLELNLDTSPQSDRDDPVTLGDIPDGAHTNKTKKRILQSDSESDGNVEESTVESLSNETESVSNDNDSGKKKGKKRIKMILSDDEEEECKDNNEDDGDVDEINFGPKEPNKEDSDKENNEIEMKSPEPNGESSPNTLDDSLHLRFDESSEEEKIDDDVDETIDDTNNKAVGNETAAEKLDKVIKDSFPATLLTQTLGSEDEDDHVPLRTIMKKKKAIIDDDDDE